MSEILEPDVFRRVMEELPVGIYFTDRNRRILFWNSGAERITGYLRQEVVGRCCRDNILLDCDHKQVVVCGSCCPLREALADEKAREASLFLRHKTGHRVPIRIHTLPLRGHTGAIIGAAECFQRQRLVPYPERRENAGNYTLTGIAEYGFMLSELRMRLARLCEGGAPFGILCVEVDHFDDFRMTRGQEACETVLHVVANTLQNAIRPGDCLGARSEGRLLVVLAATASETVNRAGDRLRALVSCSSVEW
jgi:PAS domain S-box-containing protein